MGQGLLLLTLNKWLAHARSKAVKSLLSELVKALHSNAGTSHST